MKKLTTKRLKRIFILKIDLPALLAFAFFVGLIFFYLIPGFEKAMMSRKRILIHEISSSAYSLLEYYNSLEKDSLLSSEQAKDQARAAISAIRYGESLKDYLWITDKFPHMIEHPYRPDLNGKDLREFRDSRGKTIFVDFVNAVSATGESYVEYMWQWNDDSTRVVPKLSYVRLFEPWDWIIGTGIYIEDVRSEIRKMEYRALIISGIIGFLIIILLIVISQQSHKIEQKRNLAEEELRKSRELYRTLAEASSEGVMIWSSQGLQANKTLLSWLEFTEDEIEKIKPREIFISPAIPGLDDLNLLYEELSERRYSECVLRMKTGDPLTSYVDFSRIQMGELNAVLIVIKPIKSYTEHSDFSPKTKLLNNISTGLFRISYGKKARFINATRPTLEMLGINSLEELRSVGLESFFVDPAQLLALKKWIENKEDVIEKKILLRRKDGTQFWVIFNLMAIESGAQENWGEGTIEALAANTCDDISTLDLKTYGASYILKSPVSSIMYTPVECPGNMPVNKAISIMKGNNSPCAIVTDKSGHPIGIIDTEIIVSRLAEGGDNESDLISWMSSPPLFISDDSSLDEAFRMISSSKVKCLIVSNDNKTPSGVVTLAGLSEAFFSAPQLLISEIRNATSSGSLQKLYVDSRRYVISMIQGNGDPYSVSLFISYIADTICQRILKLCIEEMGEPPCRFVFIQTGSAGRREQTLSTDQDNAIIYEDLSGPLLKRAQAYFLSLGRKVNEMLAETGFRLCKGENMAGNVKCCQPLESWKKYFSDWIKMPGPSELLEISIFFDFRYCFGDAGLSDELHEYIRSDLKTNDIFFHHMTNGWKQFNPSAAILTRKEVDIKKLLMPITGIIRLYALKSGVKGYSNMERILELYSDKTLDYHLLRDTIRAWKDLTSIRLFHQVSCLNKGVEPDNIVDFHIIESDLLSYAEQAIQTVNNLLLKAGSDFYTDQI